MYAYGTGGANHVQIRDSSVVAMICPDDRRFNSPKEFEKEIDALNRAGFKKVSIIVADGDLKVQSSLVKTPDADGTVLLRESLDWTKSWVVRQRDNLAKIPDIEIYGWDDIITASSNYPDFLERAKREYRDNDEFRAAINESINGYLRTVFRKEPEKDLSPKTAEWQSCFNYKMSEVAGLFVKAERGFTFLAYPGDLCPGLQYALDHFIHKEYPAKLLYLKVNLESKLQQVLVNQNGDSPFDFPIPYATRDVESSLEGSVVHTIVTPPVAAAAASAQPISPSPAAFPQTAMFAPTTCPQFVPESLFTHLEFELQNCKTREQMLLMIAYLNGLLSQYMVMGVPQPAHSKAPAARSDGGIIYQTVLTTPSGGGGGGDSERENKINGTVPNTPAFQSH